MEEDEIVVVLCILMIASAIQGIRRQRRRQRRWVRPWIRRRQQHGANQALMVELTTEDPGGFRMFLRMDKMKMTSHPLTEHIFISRLFA
jgi:hypothetical protein